MWDGLRFGGTLDGWGCPESKKEHPGFSVFLPTWPKSEFGGCLPVVQYSTAQHSTEVCTIVAHTRGELKNRSLILVTIVYKWYCFGYSYEMELPRAPQKNGLSEFRT